MKMATKDREEAWVIRDWDRHFETSESRKYKQLKWVATPNKQGRGYKRIIHEADGAAIFGAWNAIIQLASRMPDRGILAQLDGPLTAADIAIETLLPEELIERCLELFSSERIAWIGKVSWDSGRSSRFSGTHIQKQKQRQESGGVRKVQEQSAEPEQAPPPPLTGQTANAETETETETQAESAATAGSAESVTQAESAAPVRLLRDDISRIQVSLKTFAEHLTRETWAPPDWSISRRAASACRGNYEEAERWLRATALKRRPPGQAEPVEMRSYAFAVKLLQDHFGDAG